MAGKPQDRPMIQNERAAEASGGEPEWTENMSLSQNGSSTVVVIPSTACKKHGFAVGESVSVEIHDEGIWIPAGGSNE